MRDSANGNGWGCWWWATRNGLGDQETLGKELDLVHLWRF